MTSVAKQCARLSEASRRKWARAAIVYPLFRCEDRIEQANNSGYFSRSLRA